MAIVYLTKGLGLREENADTKTYLTKNLGLRTETQTAAGGFQPAWAANANAILNGGRAA